MSKFIVYDEEEIIVYVEDEEKCDYRRNGICYCNNNVNKIGKKCAGDIVCNFYMKERMKRGCYMKER